MRTAVTMASRGVVQVQRAQVPSRDGINLPSLLGIPKPWVLSGGCGPVLDFDRVLYHIVYDGDRSVNFRVGTKALGRA